MNIFEFARRITDLENTACGCDLCKLPPELWKIFGIENFHDFCLDFRFRKQGFGRNKDDIYAELSPAEIEMWENLLERIRNDKDQQLWKLVEEAQNSSKPYQLTCIYLPEIKQWVKKNRRRFDKHIWPNRSFFKRIESYARLQSNQDSISDGGEFRPLVYEGKRRGKCALYWK